MPTILVQVTIKGIEAADHSEAKTLAYEAVCNEDMIWNILGELASDGFVKDWFLANAKSYRECNGTFTVVIP